MNLPLHTEAQFIASTIASSTTHRSAEVAQFVLQALQARAARTAAGRASAEKRSARIRGAIRQAAGLDAMADGRTLAVLPLWDGWPSSVAHRIATEPARFGVREGEVCDDVIRSEWDLLKK